MSKEEAGVQQLEEVDSHRRALMLLGLAGASVAMLGKGGNALAAEAMQVKATGAMVGGMKLPEGVSIKTIGKGRSRIPAFHRILIQDFTFQPGAHAKMKMPNSMICEMTKGSVEVVRAGEKFTAHKGHLWTCKKGDWEENTNNGDTVAVMRVTHLL